MSPCASPSADNLSAPRGSSGPYTHIQLYHRVGKFASRSLGTNHADSCTPYAVEEPTSCWVGPGWRGIVICFIHCGWGGGGEVPWRRAPVIRVCSYDKGGEVGRLFCIACIALFGVRANDGLPS